MKRALAIGMLAAALLAPIAGCDTTAAGGSVRSLPRPVDHLAAAAAKLDGQSVKFSLDDTTSATGNIDAATKGVTLTGESDGMKVEFLALGNDLYVSTAELKGKWLHMGVAKIPDTSPLLPAVDPLFGRKFLSTAANVTRDVDGTFRGTVNLTKVSADPASPAKRLAESFATAAGAKATAIPFAANVDAQGRLTHVQMTFPGADKGRDLRYDLKILEYGATVKVAAPAKSSVIEAPPGAYNI